MKPTLPAADGRDAETADEQLQAELDVAEHVLGWRPKPSALNRITRSADWRVWTVYDRGCEEPVARQLAVYYADDPRRPDYAAAKRWNKGRQRAVTYYDRCAERRRATARTVPLPARAIVVTTTARRTSSSSGRPRARRTSSSSATSGQDPSSDSEPPPPASLVPALAPPPKLIRRGPATLRIVGHDGAFVADEAAIEGGLVHATGRWRRRTGEGYAELRYGPPVERSWPVRLVDEIRWATSESAVAA